MFNPPPGSFRGDSKVDLAGPNRMLERTKGRIQDKYSGNEETQRAENEAKVSAREIKVAARRARQDSKMSLGDRIHGWLTRSSRGS